MLWLANVHLEGSPYRPNDRISQLKHALQRLEGHMGGRKGVWVHLHGGGRGIMWEGRCEGCGGHWAADKLDLEGAG